MAGAKRARTRDVAFCLALALAPPAWAAESEDPQPAAKSKPAAAASRDGSRTLARLPANLGRGLIGVFSRDSLAPLAIGAGATGLGSFFDRDVRDAVANPGNGFGKAFEKAGGGAVSAAVVVGGFVAGRLAHGDRFRAMTYDMLEASTLNLAYAATLKVAVGRPRPNGDGNRSFPSGHASNAFALASVAERHYGWKVGLPAYAAASAMAFSRLVRNQHYLSDVLAGATLGYVVGRATVRVNGGRPERRGRRVLGLAPSLGRRQGGLLLTLAF